MYQCCLGDVCTEAECAGEDFWPCTLTAAPWQATKASCMDPAAGCRASHRWCKNRQHQKLVWEHLRGMSLRVSTLRKTVAEDCAVIGSIISEQSQNTLIIMRSSRIYTQHLLLLPTSFLQHILSHLYAKKVLLNMLFLDNVKTQPFSFTSTVPCNLIKPSSHGSRCLRLMKQVEHEKWLPDSW